MATLWKFESPSDSNDFPMGSSPAVAFNSGSLMTESPVMRNASSLSTRLSEGPPMGWQAVSLSSQSTSHSSNGSPMSWSLSVRGSPMAWQATPRSLHGSPISYDSWSLSMRSSPMSWQATPLSSLSPPIYQNADSFPQSCSPHIATSLSFPSIFEGINGLDLVFHHEGVHTKADPPAQPQVTGSPNFPNGDNVSQTHVDSNLLGLSGTLEDTRVKSHNTTQSSPIKTSERLQGIIQALEDVFGDMWKYKILLGLRGGQAQLLLDTFQVLLDSDRINTTFRRNLLVATQRLSRSAGCYPACYNLANIELGNVQAVTSGGFADIFRGNFQGHDVCLKAIRLYQELEVDSFLKQYCAEAVLWSQLSHPNLLPIYGLYRYNVRPCLVSPWMENGNINNYLLKHPGVDRYSLILDIVSGVAYLHENDIIHGDLKGANILVDESGSARVADFGLSAVSDTNVLHWSSYSSAASKGGSVRWQAPELFDWESDETVPNSKPSDVYAVSCVAYEVFTGKLPFFEYTRDAVIMVKVKEEGARPLRPPALSLAWGPHGLTEATWSTIEAGWSTNPFERPTILETMAYYKAHAQVDCRPAGSIYPMRLTDSATELPPNGEIESLLDSIDLAAIELVCGQ